MKKKLRVGIIGVGGIAQHAHIPGYQSISDQVELVACADLRRERAEEVARDHGFARSYGDYRDMLAKESLDIVSVCTPNKYHAPATIAALEAGAHVLCEKPPAMNMAEAQAMVAAARTNQRLLTFGLHYRFATEVQAAKRLIDGGELGHIYAARVDAVRRRGIPGWGVFTNKELQGGGPVIDIGVHMLDIALYLMGYPQPVQVLAETYQEVGNRPGVGVLGQWDWNHFEVEDLAMAMIKFDNGATMMLETSFAQNVDVLDKMDVRLIGRDGGATIFPLKVFKEIHGGLYDYTPAWLPGTDKPHTEGIRHFVAACRGEHPPMVGLEEAVRLQQVIDGIYASAERNDIVYMEDAAEPIK